MNGDGTWEAKAAKHAALADPARTHIVDLLARGDRSPGELQKALGSPSNLVAHHLNVMERAGLIHRRRSEGDRRRSYVTLASDAFDDLLPAKLPAQRRVVFVCTANSARSQIAAALWPRYSAIPAASAGTHPAEQIEPAAIDVAAAHGLDLSEATPKPLEAVQAADDFIISVCDTAREELPFGIDAHWSVADPVAAGTPDAFEAAFTELSHRIADFAPRLIPA